MTTEISGFRSLIGKSKKILVITPPCPSDDVLTSAFATYRFLEKQNKNATLFFGENFPAKLSFLDKPEKIKKDLAGSRDFLLLFNTERNKIINVKTEEKKKEYVIRITPERGIISPKDFSFIPASFNYDLVIILGASSLDDLGKIYHENTDLFFEIPKINIDNQSSNENYAQANIVDMTASSLAEICLGLFTEKDDSLIDKRIAQCLLTGVISATESFQKATTTPKAMVTAARLMKYKADQPTIVRHLYKTKSLSFLKLWGRVMARLSWDKEKKIAWSLISTEDFVRSRATERDIPYVLEEIQRNFSQGQIFGIFYAESSSVTRAQFRFTDKEKARRIAELFETNSNGNNLRIRFANKRLTDAENYFLDKVSEEVE